MVPEFRRRGHATAILRLSLQIARDRLGIDRVLVTCDDDNVGSIRTIEKNGGVLENVVTGPDMDTPKRRYWFDLRERRPTLTAASVRRRRIGRRGNYAGATAEL